MNLKGMIEMKNVEWCKKLDKPCALVNELECAIIINGSCSECDRKCTMVLTDTYYDTLKYLYKEK